MQFNKVRKTAQIALLTGMVALGYAFGDNKSSERAKAQPVMSDISVFDRNEGGMFETPLTIESEKGKLMSEGFAGGMDKMILLKDDKPFMADVKNAKDMPAAERDVFISALGNIRGMIGAWARVKNYMNTKGKTKGMLSSAFREDVNGVLTIWLINPLERTIKEISFDKMGQDVQPEKVGNAKRFYRIQGDASMFLCAKTPTEEYLTIEEKEMEAISPVFTYKNAQKKQYVCLGGGTYIDEGNTIRVYRGSMVDLLKEKEAAELAKKRQQVR